MPILVRECRLATWRFLVKRLALTIADIWRLAVPYFRSDDRWPGRVLLGAVIAIELALVGLQVILNQWYNRFYNTLQDRNRDAFISAILFFCVLAAVYTVLVVYKLYLNQWLQIRWRRWMTQTYLRQWLTAANHYRMQLLGDEADNPDQRIADDLRLFVEYTMAIGTGMLNAVVTLCSFVVILWTLSAQAPLTIFGPNFAIPGYLVWAALLYATIGTALTHFIGKPLIALNFQQQRFEADFRFNLVRTRENAEQIAILRGESAERTRLLSRFGFVVGNWISIMQRTKKITAFTATYSQAAVIFPFALIAPAYFAEKVQLGGMMQTVSAFGSVQDALSFIITSYRTIAEWQSVVQRLAGFEQSFENATALTVEQDIIHVTSADKAAIDLEKLVVSLPGGTPLVSADGFSINSHERTLVTGPSGAGKSTLFRAIGGVWPFGSGSIAIPAKATLMVLPQRPYFPIGSLKAAIVYPAEAAAFGSDRVMGIVTA